MWNCIVLLFSYMYCEIYLSTTPTPLTQIMTVFGSFWRRRMCILNVIHLTQVCWFLRLLYFHELSLQVPKKPKVESPPSSIVSQLIEMGFLRSKAELAVRKLREFVISSELAEPACKGFGSKGLRLLQMSILSLSLYVYIIIVVAWCDVCHDSKLLTMFLRWSDW